MLQSYIVDNDGNIDFPLVGSLHLAGLTKNAAEQLIREKIKPYLTETENPIVTVRMINYKISVLGELARPGMFTVASEKISILEALAQAGDLTVYGVRDRVKLIREDATGKKEIHVLNLNDANIINSPYYYLQQNDVVYVEPNKVKSQNASVGSVTTIALSVTSILVSIASLLVNILR
jgi:polysaccharide export outer membrane protein